MDSDLFKTLYPFFLRYKPLYYKKGQVIIRPEDNINHLYFLEKGYVRFYTDSSEGKELTSLIYKPGYIFPIIYAFFGRNTRYFFEAMTPIIVRRVPREVFTKLIESNPSLITPIAKELIIRFEENLNRMEYLAFKDAMHSVAYMIYSCSLQFGSRIRSQSVSIDLPLKHKDIASMAGLARETVSIEMKKLESEGLIFYKRNRITIKNLQTFKVKMDIQ